MTGRAQEFEKLSVQRHEENHQLRRALERSQEQAADLQARLSRCEEDNQSLRRQVEQLQETVGVLAETQSQLQKARRYIESMEQMLARQTAELETTQKQLSKHVEFARQLQILSRQSEGIWELPSIRPAEPPKPAEPAPKPSVPPTEGPRNQSLTDEPCLITSPAGASPDSAEARIAALRNQLMEQTENLRRAHETIRLLREQKPVNPAPQTSAPGPIPLSLNDNASAEVSWISKPPAERQQARAAVWQFLEEQERKAGPKPAPIHIPAAALSHAKSAQTTPTAPAEPQTPPAKPQAAEPDEKTKSLFRKFGLLGGWGSGK